VVPISCEQRIRLIAIRDTDLSVDEVREAISDRRAGGIALFLGAVRDNDDDRDVARLGYEAHPAAELEIEKSPPTSWRSTTSSP